MLCSITPYQKKLDAQREQIDSRPDPKKPKFVPGFESGLLRQNAVALPLALPPQPSFKCV